MDGEAFELRVLRVPGRPVQVLALPERREAGAPPPRLVVVAVEGQPPSERRVLVLFRRDPTRPPRVVPVGEEVVAFDVAAGPDGAPRLLALTADALLEIGSDGARRARPLAPPLPLPPRTRQLSRLAFARDWDGDGRLDALLPEPGGARLLPGLDPAAARHLPLPAEADYESPPPEDPVEPAFFAARLVWPSLARADDDGDGRPDLFATSRYALHVFRSGPDGLPARASRRVRLPALPFEEERRPQSSRVRAWPRDVDGDGLADLVVHRAVGRALRAEATTTIHRNPGDGARPDAPAQVTLDSPGGLGAVVLRDLDADGRPELVQTFVPFGLMQLVRVLLRRSVEAELRVHRVRGPGIDGLEESFRIDLHYGLDLEAGLVRGVLPTVDGDFDGDGRADLLHADGPDAVRVRLGEPGPDGPRFGDARAELALPGARAALVADLDGDGRDDVVAWNPLDREGRLWLARNRGGLGGADGDHGDAAPRDPG
ncbi:MAG: VCBS repeat-containing protein, partial [Myxococcota bacterium]|nr:VCBS repeat-containing protein [Myxococcota bacterium]